jgi:hypothetical protein
MVQLITRHVLFILVAGLIPAVGFAQTPSPEERLSRLEARVKALEDEVNKAEKAETPTSSPTASPSTVAEIDCPMELVDWNFSFEVGRFNQTQYKITYTLKNTSEKPVKLNQSTMEFRDLLGEKIYGIRVDPDLKLPPGKVVTDTKYYDANPYIPAQMRMKGMAKENIKAELVVLKVVFADDSIYAAQGSK